MQDTLKSRDKVLNIDLNVKKRSFEREIIDNSYQSWSMESISRHGANEWLYFNLGSWFRIEDIEYGQDLRNCNIIRLVYHPVGLKFDELSVFEL